MTSPPLRIRAVLHWENHRVIPGNWPATPSWQVRNAAERDTCEERPSPHYTNCRQEGGDAILALVSMPQREGSIKAINNIPKIAEATESS